MNAEDRARYAAFKAKDARFDGRFFVGIASTGIYCRPVCRARLPKAENCAFFETAVAAEQAGYRPCLLCRPELAPGNAPVDASATLAQRAARLLEEGQGITEAAAHLGCTDRHLRRVFAQAFGVPPVQYLQTCRLLLAKHLLTDTALPVIDVAMAAGFGSLRRFNDLFGKRYRLAPTALRKRAREAGGSTDDITLLLAYRPPYAWEEQLDFLALRAVPGVETVYGGEYRRTVRLLAGDKPVQGWVRVDNLPQKNAVAVTLSATLLPVLPQVLARVRHLFDLACDPAAVQEGLAPLEAVCACVPGLRVPGCFDAFEMAVRAVLGQQITVKGARTLAGRLVEAFGEPVDTGMEGLTHTFPTPQAILALLDAIDSHLGPLGIIKARARTILALAQALEGQTIDFDACTNPEAEMRKLMSISGIGEWTAGYIAMRAMGWPDVFLHTDYGVKKALAPRTPKEMLALAETLRPWCSYAVMNLWNSLGSDH